MDSVIKVNNVTKIFKKQRALDDISVSVNKGEILGLIGNNGAGKTTLLKIIDGLLAPNNGSVEYFGNRRVGALISATNIYKDMTAFENVKAYALATGYKCKNEDIAEVLKLVGLADTGNKLAGKFSTGMKQRLGLAIALIGDPDILLLDEPINGLDVQGIIDVRNILFKIHREKGTTIVVSSHILDELVKIVTRICIMDKGRIIFESSMEEFPEKFGGSSLEDCYLKIINEHSN